MRARHAAERDNARQVLKAARVPLGADFFTLSAEQVSRLLESADYMRYRKPAHANGSRGRYFHDLMQRRAAMKDPT